jgi:hypothetical protein
MGLAQVPGCAQVTVVFWAALLIAPPQAFCARH